MVVLVHLANVDLLVRPVLPESLDNLDSLAALAQSDLLDPLGPQVSVAQPAKLDSRVLLERPESAVRLAPLDQLDNLELTVAPEKLANVEALVSVVSLVNVANLVKLDVLALMVRSMFVVFLKLLQTQNPQK